MIPQGTLHWISNNKVFFPLGRSPVSVSELTPCIIIEQVHSTLLLIWISVFVTTLQYMYVYTLGSTKSHYSVKDCAL